MAGSGVYCGRIYTYGIYYCLGDQVYYRIASGSAGSDQAGLRHVAAVYCGIAHPADPPAVLAVRPAQRNMGAGYERTGEPDCDRAVRDISGKDDRKKRTPKVGDRRMPGLGRHFLSGMRNHHGIAS